MSPQLLLVTCARGHDLPDAPNCCSIHSIYGISPRCYLVDTGQDPIALGHQTTT